jgi:hypothetical protein
VGKHERLRVETLGHWKTNDNTTNKGSKMMKATYMKTGVSEKEGTSTQKEAELLFG